MLKVKPSRLKGAGKGLFTTSRIRKDDIIVPYEGEVITWKQAEKRYQGREAELLYVFHVTDDHCIDAHAFPEALAAYANDANGTHAITGKKARLKNNCEYRLIRRKPYIVATKDIGPNSEVLVDYGDEYWEAVLETIGEVKPKMR